MALERKEPRVRADAQRHEQAVQRVTEVFQRSLEPLAVGDLEALAVRIEQVATRRTDPKRKRTLLASLVGREFSIDERVHLEHLGLLEHFRRRRELLQDSLTVKQVAELLGASRQTPHDRVKSGSLLGVSDRGTLRFPPWQFDPESSDGVVTGLPQVARALRVSPLAKISWFVKRNAVLDSATPLESLTAGQFERVIELAKSVART